MTAESRTGGDRQKEREFTMEIYRMAVDAMGSGLIGRGAIPEGALPAHLLRMELKERIALIEADLKVSGMNDETAAHIAQKSVVIINLIRQGGCPIDLSRPLTQEQATVGTVVKALSRITLLRTEPLELTLPYLTGEPFHVRNPQNRDPSCDTCIAACCLSPAIELNPKEADLLMSAGTTFSPHFFDVLGFPREDVIMQTAEQLKLMSSPEAVNRISIGAEVSNKISLQASFRGRSTTKTSLNGYCAHVNAGDFSCGCYNNRPVACRDFKMGGEQCREVYVNRDSKVAQTVLTIVNDADQVLQAAARVFDLQRNPKQFVIPLQKAS